MEISREEERSLSGEEGPARQLAMEILANLGDIEGADSLIPIRCAHISGVSYRTGGEGVISFLERLLEGGGRVTVPSTLNPAGMDLDRWGEMGIPSEFAGDQMRIIRGYREIGIDPTCACNPYEFDSVVSSLGIGDHVSWSESNAVIYANSVMGARTNREGSISALASAIIGKTPNYGLHLVEGRLPDLEVVVEGEMDHLDFDLLGAFIGSRYNSRRPIFRGLGSSLPIYDLKHLGASLAAKGGIPMYHVDGITPEYRLDEDAGKAGILDESITVTVKELRESLPALFPIPDGEIDTFVLGCPQWGMEDFERFHRAARGRRLLPGKRIMIFTNRTMLEYLDGELLDGVKKTGAEVYSDTCMVVTPLGDMGVKVVGTDSGKAAHYIPGMSRMGGGRSIPASLLPLERIIGIAYGN